MNNTSINKYFVLAVILPLLLFTQSIHGQTAPVADERHYGKAEMDAYAQKYRLPETNIHFPSQSFLESGYAPDEGYVKDFTVIKYQGRYHVFHIDGRPQQRCWESGNEIFFGHASTDDFRHWIRHNMPVAIGDRPWDNAHVWAPFVTLWHDTFYMFYMAAGVEHDGVLTYATSDDLETWKKSPNPIEQAEGRDPFVRYDDDTILLYFTASAGGVRVVTSKDMLHWTKSESVINDPHRAAAESSSVQPLNHQFVIWYNDYFNGEGLSGDYRAVYALSDNPLKFDFNETKAFQFHTTTPTPYDPNDWLERRPIPVSIELVEKGEDQWLIAYFRWQTDRFRLFFGSLNWKASPAHIDEITNRAQLDSVLADLHHGDGGGDGGKAAGGQ